LTNKKEVQIIYKTVHNLIFQETIFTSLHDQLDARQMSRTLTLGRFWFQRHLKAENL